MGITVRGIDKLISNLKVKEAEVRIATAKALMKSGEYVLGKSMPLVPLDEGDLRASGHVESEKAMQGSVTVSYNTDYALKQHEDLELKHTEPGTQAKYLEQPGLQAKNKIQDFIKTEIIKALK